MDARRPCPDAALLAAFLDDALADYERTAVVTHLAECAQCRSVALTVIEFREVEALDTLWTTETTSNVVTGPITRVSRWTIEKTRAPAWIALGVGTLAALAIPLQSHNATSSAQQALSRMLAAAAHQRPLSARLADDSSDMAHALPSGRSPLPASLVFVAEHVRENYGNDYDVPSRRAVGVAALMTSDLDSAVASLSIAASAAPDDGRVANDLAAAYFERAQRLDRPEDLPAALNAIEAALRVDPQSSQARFNRALIISALGLAEEARAAWRDYLGRDSSSPWALEARERLESIEESGMTESEWRALRQQLLSADDSTALAAVIDRGGSRVRELFDNDLLRDWSVHGASTTATTIVQRMRVVADAVDAKTGDPYFVDVAAHLGALSKAGVDRRMMAAAAYRDLLAGLAFVKDRNGKAAEPLLSRALAGLRTLGSPAALTASVEGATALYLQNRDFVAAARIAAAVREEARRRGYLHLATRSAWVEGLAYFGLKDLAAARVAYEDMLVLASATGDPEHLVMANGLLATLHMVEGNHHGAWRHLVNALMQLPASHTPTTRSNIMQVAGVQAMASKYFAAALLFQSHLLRSGVELNPLAETQLRTQLAATFTHLDQLVAASAEIQKARALIPAVEDAEARARVEADVLAAEAELLQPQDPTTALRIAERALGAATAETDMFRRGRLLFRVADAALASGQLDRAADAANAGIAALQAYRSTPPGAATPASDYELPLYGIAMQVALRHGDVARAFDYSERRRRRVAVGDDGTPSASLPDVQRTLPPDAAIIVLNHVNDVLHVWTIKRDGIATSAVAFPLSRVSSLVKSHLDEVARATTRPLKSAELYDLIFRPLALPLRGVQTIGLVADEPFAHIAYAGLWDARRNRFLIEDYRLTHTATGTPLVPHAMRRAPASAARVGIVEVADRTLHAEPRRDALAADLSKLYGSVEVRRGDMATPSRVLRQLSEMDVIHLAAPIVADRSDIVRGRIIVADEPGRKYSGSLSFVDLERAIVRTRLVTLDPEVAERAPTNAEGTHSIARALIAAGVSDVVGPVALMPSGSDEGTWLEFHRQYMAGWSAVDSLRRAQLTALGVSRHRTGPWATLTVFSSAQ